MTQLDRLLEFADSQLGQGEVGANNAGPYVRTLHRGARESGNWCAAFVAWCLESVHVCPPIPDRHRRGAKGLVKYLAEQLKTGEWVARPRFGRAPEMREDLRPGDVIAWHRSRGATTWEALWRDWRGHVELVAHSVDDGTLVTYAGNVGAFPAHVTIRAYEPGTWQKRLYGIARLGVLHG